MVIKKVALFCLWIDLCISVRSKFQRCIQTTISEMFQVYYLVFFPDLFKDVSRNTPKVVPVYGLFSYLRILLNINNKDWLAQGLN